MGRQAATAADKLQPPRLEQQAAPQLLARSARQHGASKHILLLLLPAAASFATFTRCREPPTIHPWPPRRPRCTRPFRSHRLRSQRLRSQGLRMPQYMAGSSPALTAYWYLPRFPSRTTDSDTGANTSFAPPTPIAPTLRQRS